MKNAEYDLNYYFKTYAILTLLLLLASCNSSTDSKDCSTSSSCSNASDPASTGTIKTKIDFANAYFFNQATNTWRTIPASEMSAGGMGAEIPIYSDFVNLSNNVVLPRVQASKDQFNNQGSYSPSTYNTIPYVSVVAEDNYTYVFNYTKIDLSGVEIAGKTGSMVVSGGLAYLPLTNEMLGGVFYPESSTNNSSSYTHRIRIVAQSANKSSNVYTVSFKSNLIVPPRDFIVSYSDAMNQMTYENRWNYFYKNSDGVANTDLELATMIESTSTPESIPLDIKVLYKTAPKIEIAYTIFDEDFFVKSDNSPEAELGVIRGNAFYEKTYVLNSERDFGLVFKINNTPVTLTNSDREAELRDIPAGQLWRLTFGYDLSQKPTYPAGKNMLKPLRNLCLSISNQPFNPISELQTKLSYANLGGYVSVCHPDNLQKYLIPSADVPTSTVELTDSWFWGFSYIPTKEIEKNAQSEVSRTGHFYGIKNIQFRISGCMKVMTREASPAPINPNVYEVKNTSSASCSTGAGDTGWMAYEIVKTLSIFDNTSQYAEVLGLLELVNTYRNAIPKNSTEFYFNGDTFFEHLH